MSAPSSAPGVLLDASNLHRGGAVQVAASFLDELARLPRSQRPDWWGGAVLEVSNAVAANLAAASRRVVSVVDRHPSLRAWHRTDRRFDVAFTVFGPVYRTRIARSEITGFAASLLLTPGEQLRLGRSGADPFGRVLARAERTVKLAALRRADVLVVESQAVRATLQQRAPHVSRDVHVVPNAYTGVFDDPTRWVRPPSLPERAGDEVVLAAVARDYPHKNLSFLPLLGRALERDHGLQVRFLVTLTEAEYDTRGDDFRRYCRNVGVRLVAELPALYQHADAVIFPSLAEVCSATPLEAMRMGRALFASDRAFVRDVCLDAPIYFDPVDPAQAAGSIAAAISMPSRLAEHARRGLELVAQLPSAADRARRYVEIIDAEWFGAGA